MSKAIDAWLILGALGASVGCTLAGKAEAAALWFVAAGVWRFIWQVSYTSGPTE